MVNIKIVGVDKEVLGSIRELDKECYETIVPITWYTDNYKDLESIVVATDGVEIVGYCCITGIKRDVFGIIIKGYLSGDVSLSEYAFKGLADADYYYVSSILVQKEYRNRGLAGEMVAKAVENVEKYNEYPQLCAICISDIALKILKDAGFKKSDRCLNCNVVVKYPECMGHNK